MWLAVIDQQGGTLLKGTGGGKEPPSLCVRATCRQPLLAEGDAGQGAYARHLADWLVGCVGPHALTRLHVFAPRHLLGPLSLEVPVDGVRLHARQAIPFRTEDLLRDATVAALFAGEGDSTDSEPKRKP